MTAQTEPLIEDVVARAVELFNQNEVKHYLEDRWEEFRGAGRAYEAGDAVRDALAELTGEQPTQSEYDQTAPSFWPEAEELVRAQISGYDEEVARRQKLGYQT